MVSSALGYIPVSVSRLPSPSQPMLSSFTSPLTFPSMDPLLSPRGSPCLGHTQRAHCPSPLQCVPCPFCSNCPYLPVLCNKSRYRLFCVSFEAFLSQCHLLPQDLDHLVRVPIGALSSTGRGFVGFGTSPRPARS